MRAARVPATVHHPVHSLTTTTHPERPPTLSVSHDRCWAASPTATLPRSHTQCGTELLAGRCGCQTHVPGACTRRGRRRSSVRTGRRRSNQRVGAATPPRRPAACPTQRPLRCCNQPPVECILRTRSGGLVTIMACRTACQRRPPPRTAAGAGLHHNPPPAPQKTAAGKLSQHPTSSCQAHK